MNALQTNRLHLIPYSRSDFGDYVAIFCDATVMERIWGGERSLEQAQSSFGWLFSPDRVPSSLHAFRVLLGGRQIGHCEIGKNDRYDAFEARWFFLPEYWGQGYAIEVGQEILGFAFIDLGLGKVIAIAHPDHTAAVRVLEKLGFSSELIEEDGIWRCVFSRVPSQL